MDCKNGYWQVPLDQESTLLTTFNTPFGRYKWNRMPFGISPAGEIFQRRLDQAIEGLDGVQTVADDILTIGNEATMEEAVRDHDVKMKPLLDRCREKYIKLNHEKIDFKKTSVPYIGHLLTYEGLKADPSKIEAILSLPKPEDVAGVRHIMGTVNYLAKFLPRLSDVSKPLRELTRKNSKFAWTTQHDRALGEIKQLVTKSPVLKYHEPEKPLVLQCDASEKGLGASLLQEGRPIAYASRALTPAECNYAQIEKELLAIVFGVGRFHQYTYGRKVTVDFDHKPLQMISQKPLASAPRRLQKMLMRLQQYDIDVRYKKGTEMFLADTLSRHLIKDTSNTSVHQLRSEFAKELEEPPDPDEISQLTVSQELTSQIREDTDRDEVLQAVKATIQSRWPDSKRNIAPKVSPYFPFRDELVVEEGLIMRGDRLVVPHALRKGVIKDLHSAHQEVESTSEEPENASTGLE